MKKFIEERLKHFEEKARCYAIKYKDTGNNDYYNMYKLSKERCFELNIILQEIRKNF